MSVLTFSTFANAGLIIRGCYQESNRKYGPYSVVVSIFNDSVTIEYKSVKYGNLGMYSGRINSPDDIYEARKVVSVDKVTLSDGANGLIEDAFIEIAQDSITIDSKNSNLGPQVRLVCHL